MNIKSFFLLLLIILVFTERLPAREFLFNKYNIDEGLFHSFVYSVHQDDEGFLWFGTGNGLCRFDGNDFKMPPGHSDTINYSPAACSFKDMRDRLWFGHQDGRISMFNGRKHQVIEENLTSSAINDVAEDMKGHVFFATQNEGIVIVDTNLQVDITFHHIRDFLIYSLHYIGKDRLLIGTDKGLFIYHYKDRTVDVTPVAPQVDQVRCLLSIAPDRFLVGTNFNGLYYLNINNKEATLVEGLPFNEMNIQDLMQDSDGDFWISTFGQGVYQVQLSGQFDKAKKILHFTDRNGLGSVYIKQTYEDHEGNIWIATYGQGVAGFINKAFSFYELPDTPVEDQVFSVVSSDNRFFVGGLKGVMMISDDQEKEALSGLPTDKVNALSGDADGNIWIGTEKNGVWLLKDHNISQIHVSENSLANKVQDIALMKDTAWIATQDGIYVYDLGDDVIREIDHFNTMNGLPHNNVFDLLITSRKDVLFATKSNGIYSLNSDRNYPIDASSGIEFTCITEDSDGEIWAGTNGNGVFLFLKDSIINYSTENGLKSDYCYNLQWDPVNRNIWVGHRLGLSQIDPAKKVINTFGPQDGFKADYQQGAVYRSKDSALFWGTNDGLIHYEPRLDQHKDVPPLLSIQSVIINDKEVDHHQPVKLPYGAYKIRIRFKGVHYQAPEKVTYQYRLKGYDLDWSDRIKEDYVQYNRVEDGQFVFQVRSCSEALICNEQPVTLKIQIAVPFWKTLWFYGLVILFLIILIVSIVRYREAKQKRFQKHLQKLLDERTAEVVRQKDEIEEKNKSIMDSIAYAERIQSAMIPSVNVLKDFFSEAFVFFQPRDVISGDFFWHHKLSEDEFLVVCADCTGHGVPGSLVAMIGMTLIKDITIRNQINGPAEILETLQKEFVATLNQNADHNSNDGIDLTIGLFNKKKRTLTVASAMRPVLIYTGGELVHVKATKVPIGGIQFKINPHFKFDEYHYQLNEGDAVYFFSDGYIDQFGGKDDSKFMMGRMKEKINQVHGLPMVNQEEFFIWTFNEWMGERFQVDDVLLMGMRV